MTMTEILGAKEFPALEAEYAAECGVKGLPTPKARMEMYHAIEISGVLHPFGEEIDGALVGFVIVLAPRLPHYDGVVIPVCESLFVAKAHRATGAGLRLIKAAEQLVGELGAPGLFMSAPLGGQIEGVLPRLGYTETGRVFFKRSGTDD